MKTIEELQKDFREDLEVLLKNHNAEIDLVYQGNPYMEYQVIEIYIQATWDENGVKLTNYTDFLL